MSSFNGKVALVTGASRGIGRSITEALAAAGAAVVVNYATRADEANTAVDGIRQRRGTAIAVQGDVSNSDAVEQMVEEAVAELGPITIVVQIFAA